MPRKKAATPSLAQALRKKGKLLAPALTEVMEDWSEPLRRLYPRWIRQLKFVEGEQWGRFDRRRGVWVPRAGARKEVQRSRMTLNHMQPIIAQMAALMTRERPMMGAFAASADAEDVAASKTMDALVRFIWRQFGFDDTYYDIVDFTGRGGTWALEMEWDANAGRQVEAGVKDIIIRETGDPDAPPEVELEFFEEPEGMLSPRLRSVFELIPPPTSSADRPGEGLGIQLNMELAEVHATYGDAAREVVPDARRDESGADYHMSARLDGHGNFYTGKDDETDESVRVYKLYTAATREDPRGRYIQFTRHVVLSDTDNPIYPTEDEPDELWPRKGFIAPVFVFRHYVIPASWHGKGVAADLIDPQLALNGAVSKELAIMRTHAHPRMKAPIGYNINLDDDPDAILEYPLKLGSDAVSYLQAPQYPNELVLFEQRMRQNMEIIAGLNAATQGRANAEDSGRKVQLLQQQDIGRLAPIKARHDRTMAEALRFGVVLHRRHSTTEQKLAVLGDNHRISLEVFEASKIGGKVDLIVQNDQSLPSEPVARALTIQQAFQTAATLDPAEKGKFWEMHSLRDFMKVEESMFADRNRAREENVLMSQGVDVPVEWFEDHTQHIVEHLAEANTTAWRARVQDEAQEAGLLPQQTDAYQRLIGHVQQHQLQMLQSQQGAALQQAQAGGTPANPAAPPTGAGPSVAASQPSVAAP